mgnify:CR=1 FL=1
MENYFKKIKMEDVNEIIKKNGFYYIPTKVLYTDFVGPKYIVATDDPQFKQKHPELADMVIVSVAMFAEMAKEYNRYFANEVREKRRQSRYHIDEGYYEDCEEDENGNCPNLKIKDLPLNPVQDEVENRETTALLREAFLTLTETQLRRTKMHFYDGLTEREIGEIEGVSYKQVRKSIEQSKKKMKSFFENRGLKTPLQVPYK